MIIRESLSAIGRIALIVGIALGISTGELSYFQILILFVFVTLTEIVSIGLEKIEQALKK